MPVVAGVPPRTWAAPASGSNEAGVEFERRGPGGAAVGAVGRVGVQQVMTGGVFLSALVAIPAHDDVALLVDRRGREELEG